MTPEQANQMILAWTPVAITAIGAIFTVAGALQAKANSKRLDSHSSKISDLQKNQLPSTLLPMLLSPASTSPTPGAAEPLPPSSAAPPIINVTQDNQTDIPANSDSAKKEGT